MAGCGLPSSCLPVAYACGLDAKKSQVGLHQETGTASQTTNGISKDSFTSGMSASGKLAVAIVGVALSCSFTIMSPATTHTPTARDEVLRLAQPLCNSQPIPSTRRSRLVQIGIAANPAGCNFLLARGINNAPHASIVVHQFALLIGITISMNKLSHLFVHL